MVLWDSFVNDHRIVARPVVAHIMTQLLSHKTTACMAGQTLPFQSVVDVLDTLCPKAPAEAKRRLLARAIAGVDSIGNEKSVHLTRDNIRDFMHGVLVDADDTTVDTVVQSAFERSSGNMDDGVANGDTTNTISLKAYFDAIPEAEIVTQLTVDFTC